MSRPDSKLTPRQERMIIALLSSGTQAEAAAKAGIGVATLGRWLRTEPFRAAYREARRAVVEHAVARLQQATGRAVDALEELLASAHPPTKARAALGIMVHALRGSELIDLMERLEQLERLLGEQRATHGGPHVNGSAGTAGGGSATPHAGSR
jgi:hypothetical protein